jgi:glutamate synthase (NADPH/NADH) small chain
VRFGVPDFKIEKSVVERRVEQMRAEGVELKCGVDVGRDVSAEELRARYDAIVLATGSRVPRDLDARGRDLDGVHFAMDYLYERNRWVAREIGPTPTVAAPPPLEAQITAAGKDVVVIGGGDTGADCVGNALREGARSIVQLELLSEPPPHRPDDRTPWPEWPLKYRLSYAMEEAQELGRGEQDYSIATTAFSGEGGRVQGLTVAQAAAEPPFAPLAGTERELPAQLVLLAMGFLHPEQDLLEQLGVERDRRGNVRAVSPYTTSGQGIFAAGDARRGQSLIVWAINEGRQCARMVDRYLAGLDGADPRASSGRGPRDEGLAGHADADEGPEGPPQHVGPGVPAG